ncbi:MAG: hypothetical protein NPIRA04_17440 [Nitrospirales bacterium]|nr:MAG: hypothetical protein NPIRA04_17440 [Nitrospirales bacterium]
MKRTARTAFEFAKRNFKKFQSFGKYETKKHDTYIEGTNSDKLWKAEWERYLKYRSPRPERTSEFNEPTVEANLVGLALSGGGIRSATFNLGLLQSLARVKLLKYIDYLSTVSGGSYIGSCLSKHLCEEESQLEGNRFPFAYPAQDGQTGEERPEVRHLRNHSKFLAPQSGLFSLHTWHLVGTYLSGLLVLLPVPASVLILVAGILDLASVLFMLDFSLDGWTGNAFWQEGLLKKWAPSACQADMNIWHFLIDDMGLRCWTSGTWAPSGLHRILVMTDSVLLAVFFFSVLVYLRFTKANQGSNGNGTSNNNTDPLKRKAGQAKRREGLARFQAYTLMVAFSVFLITTLPTLVGLSPSIWVWLLGSNMKEFIYHAAALSLLLSLLLTLSANRNWEKKWINQLSMFLGKTGVVIFLVLLGLALLNFYLHHKISAALISIITIALAFLFLDPNRASLHFYYRDRLAQAYLSSSQGTSNEFVPDHDLLLRDLYPHLYDKKLTDNQTFSPPYHLINAAINLTGDSDKEDRLRGRKSHLFEFSGYYCGSKTTGWRDTTEYASGEMDVATAMAISGAAAGPQMGMYTSRPLGILMALLNIRLGSWEPNPQELPGLGDLLKTFFLELFALTSRHTPYVNLSDGGHFENLGLYSLIQRRCRYIIVSDAGHDKDSLFEDLEDALRKIRIDFGVEIQDFNPEILKPGDNRYSQAYCAIGKIVYPSKEEGQKEYGTLIYLKPMMFSDLPIDIIQYQKKNPKFPHDSTFNQLFDEARFENYRTLGYHIGKKIFSPGENRANAPNAFDVKAIFEPIIKSTSHADNHLSINGQHTLAVDLVTETPLTSTAVASSI